MLLSIMHTTPVSLLQRLRTPADPEAWRRFVHLYAPLLHFWMRRTGLAADEADDLVQEIFAVLVRQMPAFEYQPGRTFRGWLRTVALNKWRESKRRKSMTTAPLPPGDLLDEAAADPAEQFWEQEFRTRLVRRALALMQADFPEKTWRACWQMVVDGKSAAEVAAEQGSTPGAVHAAKFRVLARLREELSGMMD